MKKLIICLFTTLLSAQNPIVYSALGDIIYDNIENIQNLKNIVQYKKHENKIDKYASDVKNLKEIGFKIQSGDEKYKKLEYLQNLRELSKVNDFFLRSVEKDFNKAIKCEDSKLFSKILNSGLIDVKEYKTQIKSYYLSHSRDINTSGVIQNILDKEFIKKQKKKSQVKRLTKKQLQEAKIKRIRENDKIKQENIKKSLEDIATQKKIKIREEQKQKLAH